MDKKNLSLFYNMPNFSLGSLLESEDQRVDLIHPFFLENLF